MPDKFCELYRMNVLELWQMQTCILHSNTSGTWEDTWKQGLSFHVLHSLPTRRIEDIRNVLNLRQGRRKLHYIINIHPNLAV
jgi:hypothetical protein